MNNNIIALVIMAIGILGCSAKASNNFRIGGLVVLGIILLGVGLNASSAGDNGPLFALLAFVGTFGAIALFRRRG